MQTTIIATKTFNGRLVERKFGQYAWDLLGNDKGGWVAKQDHSVIASIPLPPKGETKTQTVTAAPKVAQPSVPEVSQEIKNEFMTIASKISKGVIKDYFDKTNAPYSNTANIIEIRTQLAVVLNYDIKKLNEAFQ